MTHLPAVAVLTKFSRPIQSLNIFIELSDTQNVFSAILRPVKPVIH